MNDDRPLPEALELRLLSALGSRDEEALRRLVAAWPSYELQIRAAVAELGVEAPFESSEDRRTDTRDPAGP